MIYRIAGLLCMCGAFASCGNTPTERNDVLIVSIEPLRFIVEQIVGDDFEVGVLVPPGASPETYEPTPDQIGAAEDARLVFSTGLIGFEQAMLKRLPLPERIADLSVGIELIGSEHEHGHGHGGVDPHIWVAPRALAQMAQTAYTHIHEIYPDSTSYKANYELFAKRLTELDQKVSQRLANSATRSFMIFHPGLTYYARDYGLKQISLEIDGKEPSAKQLAETVATARAAGISKVLYQAEFPIRVVEIAATEIGAKAVEIDILGYDVIGNILKITDSIADTTVPTDTP